MNEIVSAAEIQVKLVQNPISVIQLFPDYKFELQNAEISVEATQMGEDLLEFIKTNSDIAIDETSSDKDAYIKGFQRAIAIVRLWIDSMYMNKPNSPTNN